MRTSQQPTEQQHFQKNRRSLRNINSSKPHKIAGSYSRWPRSQTSLLALANTSFGLWEMARHARMQHLRWFLIHPKFIISAAHCVPSEASGTMILGAHAISYAGKQRIRVKKFVIHPSWNAPAMFDHDISVI